MRKLIVSLFLVSGLFGANTVDNAFILCRALDNTNLLSKECSVSGWNQSVDVHMDMSSGEARKTCPELVSFAKSNGLRFDKGWKLKIFSPYSNGNTIAQCNF